MRKIRKDKTLAFTDTVVTLKLAIDFFALKLWEIFYGKELA